MGVSPMIFLPVRIAIEVFGTTVTLILSQLARAGCP
jgi:hypothetical protein